MKTRKKTIVSKTVSSPPKKLLVSLPSSMNKKTKYENDFYLWTSHQAQFLKQGEFSKLDIENLIEEIESLGRSERRTLESYLEILLMHMLKVKYQPEKRSKFWELSIKNSHQKFKKILKQNPSLKPKLDEIFKDAYASARLDAALETGLSEKTFPTKCPWKIEEIL